MFGSVTRALFALSLVLATALGAARAEPLPLPTERVALRIAGSIARTNEAGAAVFDIPMLESLGPVTIETTTLWTQGKQTFTGVPLARLLDAVGAKGAVIEATAINDYWVEIPVSDAVPDGPIIAWERNGRPLSIRDKGPLWLVYPYDSRPEYQSEVIYARSIWQLTDMLVRP